MDSAPAHVLAALGFASSVRWDRWGLGAFGHGIVCSLRCPPLATLTRPHGAQPELPGHCHSLLWGYTENTPGRKDHVEPSRLQLESWQWSGNDNQ